MHRGAGDMAAVHLHFADVDANPDLEAEESDRFHDLLRAAQGPARCVEGRKESVARCVLALRPLTAEQAADLLEVIEDRYQLRSTIVTSQLPVSEWHSSLGEPSIADAILDRLIHNAHRIELRGDSLRRLQEPALAATSDLEKRRDEPETAQKRGRREQRAATMPQDAR